MYFLRFGWAAHWHQLKLNPDCGERRHICPSARGKKAQVQLKSRVEMLILGQRTSDSRDTLTLVQKSETRKASSRDADITESKAALALLQAGVWEAGKINKRAHTHIHTHEPRSHTLRAHTHTQPLDWLIQMADREWCTHLDGALAGFPVPSFYVKAV